MVLADLNAYKLTELLEFSYLSCIAIIFCLFGVGKDRD